MSNLNLECSVINPATVTLTSMVHDTVPVVLVLVDIPDGRIHQGNLYLMPTQDSDTAKVANGIHID